MATPAQEVPLCQSTTTRASLVPTEGPASPAAPQGKPAYFPEGEEEIHSSAMLPEAQNRATVGGAILCDQKI